MKKLWLLCVSLGGTITMLPTESGGIAPKLGAEMGAESLFRLPSPSRQTGHLVQVAGRIKAAPSAGIGPGTLRCP